MKRRSVILQAIVLSTFFLTSLTSFAPAKTAPEVLATLAPAPLAQIIERPAPEWRTSQAALSIIKEAEKLRLKAYFLAGQWLIGYGHAGETQEGMEITTAKAEQLLRTDVSTCEDAVADAVNVPVTHNEFSALVAFCYNVGPGSLQKSSIIRRLNRQDRQGAADAFLFWTHATINDVHQAVASLVERRRKERDLFLSDRAPLDRIVALRNS